MSPGRRGSASTDSGGRRRPAGRLNPTCSSRSRLPGPALEQAAKAKAICLTCRVRPECLAFALRTEQVHGIWGGTTEHERAAARRVTVGE
jgi:Transcription factor WhiB